MNKSCKLTCDRKIFFWGKTQKKCFCLVVNLDQLDNSIADDKTGWLQSVVAEEEREGRMAKKDSNYLSPHLR